MTKPKHDRTVPQPIDVEAMVAVVSDNTGVRAAAAAAQQSHEQWWEERRARGQDVMAAARRTWSAMQGWDQLETQEQWQQLRDQTAEDWQNGTQLLTMLGGVRYVEPGRAALCLLLWQQFIEQYQAQAPAQYMAVAMAVLSFDHFLRLNGIVHNIEARLESEFFGLGGLHTDRNPHPAQRGSGGLVASEVVEQLGQELLPLLDRLNRLVLRNLRALKELTGTPLAVTVANYGQLNVGQTQTNQAATSPAGRHSVPRGSTRGRRTGGRAGAPDSDR